MGFDVISGSRLFALAAPCAPCQRGRRAASRTDIRLRRPSASSFLLRPRHRRARARPFPEREIVGGEFQPWSGRTPARHRPDLGRDMLSRLIYGARNTVGIAFATTALAFLLGGILGLIAATAGGWTDQALSRLVDV
jgi:ABC-type dipeptide/oligopeptide/nickel transport system permease subunit